MDNYTKMCSLLEPLQKENAKKQDCIFLPDSDWLMEKLGKRYIFLSFNKAINEWDASNPQTAYGFKGNTPQEALLKLVAYECYGKWWVEPDGKFEGDWQCIEA